MVTQPVSPRLPSFGQVLCFALCMMVLGVLGVWVFPFVVAYVIREQLGTVFVAKHYPELMLLMILLAVGGCAAAAWATIKIGQRFKWCGPR